MQFLLLHSHFKLLGKVAPLAVGAAAAGVAQCSPSETLPCSSWTLRLWPGVSLPTHSELEEAGPGMLLGRGDPRTRKGKVRCLTRHSMQPWESVGDRMSALCLKTRCLHCR